MKDPTYWKRHYVTAGSADEIERASIRVPFESDGFRHELVGFEQTRGARGILVSPGSGGHPFVFAELAHALHRRGFSVFIMPKHGGHTVDKLVRRHRDALATVATRCSSVGLYGEGLGGYIAFYAALAGAPMRSLACENSPAILIDPAYHRALLTDGGPWKRAARRRRLIVPIARRVVRVAPWLPVPIAAYLDWRSLIDARASANRIERALVEDGYLGDRDFDRWYPLSAVMSLVSTPPARPVEQLSIPTMFVVASEGPTPEYVRSLFARLGASTKRLLEVEGSVYWMLSHLDEATTHLSRWFGETL